MITVFKKIFVPVVCMVAMNASLAARPIDTSGMTQECNQVSREIFDLVQNMNFAGEDTCNNRFNRAGAFVKTAAIWAEKENYQLGVLYFLTAEKHLRFIQKDKAICPQLASLSKPYIARVMALKNNLAQQVDDE